jgi:hypothetical protein
MLGDKLQRDDATHLITDMRLSDFQLVEQPSNILDPSQAIRVRRSRLARAANPGKLRATT